MNRNRSETTKATAGKPRHRKLSSTERIDRLELLSHSEALLIQAMSHAMHLGFGGELNWPVLIVRPNGTRVNVLEQAVDLAAERLAELCERIEAELIEVSGLPTRDIHDRYKVVEPRSREYPQPNEKLHPDPKNTDKDAARPGPRNQPTPIPAMPRSPKEDVSK